MNHLTGWMLVAILGGALAVVHAQECAPFELAHVLASLFRHGASAPARNPGTGRGCIRNSPVRVRPCSSVPVRACPP